MRARRDGISGDIMVELNTAVLNKTREVSEGASLTWFARNSMKLARISALLFGLIWGLDAFSKFYFDTPSQLPGWIQDASTGQPAWILGWYTFWYQASLTNSALMLYGAGAAEGALAFALIFGFARKLSYVVGPFLSFLIWAVPEGLGGPFGSGYTDPGSGVVYLVCFLVLMALNATHGTDPYTIDAHIEKKYGWWRKIAEFN